MFLNFRNTNFKVLENGFLNITAKICKEGVVEFKGAEVDSDKETVKIFYPYREFANSKFLGDLRKTPVIVGHHDVTVDNSETVVGHVVSDPILEDGAIVVDLLIENKDAIEKIKSKALEDTSLYFRAEFIPEAGEFDKIPFDFQVKNVKLEHIALVPPGQGRMGKDVRVYNSKVNTMEENNSENVEQVTETSPEKDNPVNQEEFNKLKAEYEQLKQKLKSGEDALEQSLSQALLDNEKASEIAQFANMKLEKNLIGAKLHGAVLKNIGVDTEGMDDKQLSAAFSTASVLIKRMKTVKPDEKKKVDDIKVFTNSKPLVDQVDIRNDSDIFGDDALEKKIWQAQPKNAD